MARIADKYGLTNRYRSTGKRVVKRGRPRKYLFGSPKRTSYSKRSSANTSATMTNREAFGMAIVICLIATKMNAVILREIILCS